MLRFCSAAIAILFLLGCSGAKKDGKKKSEPSGEANKTMKAGMDKKPVQPKARPKAVNKPKGPVYKAKMMGVENVEPIVELELTKAKLPGLKLKVPKSAKIERKSPRGFKIIATNVNYSVTIEQSKFKPKMHKKVFKIVDDKGTLLKDEKDLVVFKRSGAKGSVLFAVGLTVGGKQYTCSTVATAFSFTQNQADQMIKSCRSLQAAK